MKKSKLFLTAALVGLLGISLVGCGKKKTTPTEATTTETSSEETTTTEEQTTEAVHHDGVYNDLTGEWVDRDEEYGRPVTVMINNITDALPQSGIGEADIVYEMMVEGGITRLLGIYSDYSDLEKIGSIRSCRPYYVVVSLEYDAIYMHYGQSPQGADILASSNIDHLSGLDAEGGVTYYRSSDRVAPHNVYSNSDMIQAGIEYKKYDTKHPDSFKSMFQFNEEITAPKDGEKAEKVNIAFDSKPYFEYNKEDGLYYRYQYNGEHIDAETGKQLAYENVIIQLAHYTSIDDHDRQQLDLVGSGEGYYASNGVIIPIKWKKASENSQTEFTTADGKELLLNPGKTFVEVFENDKTGGVTWE